MHELVLGAPQSLVEPVSDALIEELAALSVSVEDADAGRLQPGINSPFPVELL